MNRNVLIPLDYEVALSREQQLGRPTPSRKILVPLDGSEKAEKVLDTVQELLTPGSQGILLNVVSPGKSKRSEGNAVSLDKQVEGDRTRVMGYLRGVVDHRTEAPGRWRCEVVAAESVAQGIADFAIREGVDLIAMYTNDRKGLAKLIRGSIAEKVQQRTPTEIRVVKPSEPAGR
jgi:nucleotide-binding universal stress UspA family protein